SEHPEIPPVTASPANARANGHRRAYSRNQAMHYVPVVIIGAGQAGLAMSYCLRQRRIDHVVLERGQVGERWRSERWDSLRLLTPNWMSRLPGWSYYGDDPDGFMTASEATAYFSAYA